MSSRGRRPPSAMQGGMASSERSNRTIEHPRSHSTSIHTIELPRSRNSTQPPSGDEEVDQPGDQSENIRGRKILYLSPTSGTFHPSLKVRATATDIFQQMQFPEGVNWDSLPTRMKDLYWGEFQKYYTWNEEDLSTAVVKMLWSKIAALAYADFVSSIKRKYYGEQKQREKIRLQENVLEKWVAYWELPEVKAKSMQARKNRFSEPAGPGTGYSIHHGGSRSAEIYTENMAREKKCAPSECLIDTHMYFHYKDGKWTDRRAEWVMEEVNKRLADIQEPITNEMKNKVYLEVNKPNKKGRIVGQGNLSKYYDSSSRVPNPFMSQPSQVSSDPTILKMQEEIDQRKQNEENLKSQLDELRRELRGVGEFLRQSQFGYTPNMGSSIT